MIPLTAFALWVFTAVGLAFLMGWLLGRASGPYRLRQGHPATIIGPTGKTVFTGRIAHTSVTYSAHSPASATVEMLGHAAYVEEHRRVE